ncbi:MAG TPA: ABC transporter ATP-binding protein [Bryobacteraceae bacterium]|jgi:cobalt/nickel transport system ATP-binding protein|nr:ABC transporter ATP-binding protein [Bryobacteraceae bacterium]
MTVFETRDLVYRYDRQAEPFALRGVSMSVNAGERIALLGANGSGKSTLLRLLDGLGFPESGEVLFHGEALTEKRLRDSRFSFPFRRRVGFVFQNPDVQLFNPTVFEEVAFGPLQMRWPADEIRRKVGEILEKMDLSAISGRAPHRLSGGEKKRVALASVLVLDPEVLLLDEPTAMLDPQSQSQILNFLVSWGRSREKTVILATHDLDSLDAIADRCYLFQNGAIAAEGSPAEILRDPSLLERTRMTHAHWHTHPDGSIHSHPHLHGHKHE